MNMFHYLKKLLNPHKDIARLVKEGAIVIDVRTRSEFEAGKIEGSINIPLDTIHNKVIAIKKMNRPVVTVCRSGNRSGSAQSLLSAAGIEVYNGGDWEKLKEDLQQV